MNPTGATSSALSPESFEAAQRAGQMGVAFAADLFQRACASAKPGSNVFVSPFSVGAALALAMEGAKGDTAAQLKKAIGYPADHDPAKLHHDVSCLVHALGQGAEGVELAVANALWVASNFAVDQSFVARAKELLAEARNVDFHADPEAARQTINAWVEEKTKQKIKDLLPTGSVNKATPLVITNAIYFKGAWMRAFKQEDTRDEDFHLLDNGGTKRVKMMSQRALKTRYAGFDDHAMAQLSYKGNEVVMLVMLPHENTSAALDALCSEESLKKITEKQRMLAQAEVNIKMPRFKFDFEVELSKLLQEMGIQIPFTGDADFSAMVSPDSTVSERLAISKVFHKAFVDVNEEGTEAAAATAVVLMRAMAAVPRPPVNFVVDRPFAFVLYHARLQCPLFIGKVLQP